MNLIIWKQSYSVGIEEMDQHHQRLMQLLNSLYENFVNATPTLDLVKIFDELTKYTKYHFVLEEELMQTHTYPSFEEHRMAHQQFTARLEEMLEGFRSGKRNFSLELLTFLNAWFLSHILSIDADMGQFINTENNQVAT